MFICNTLFWKIGRHTSIIKGAGRGWVVESGKQWCGVLILVTRSFPNPVPGSLPLTGSCGLPILGNERLCVPVRTRAWL